MSNSIPVILSKTFSEFKGVKHGFFTRNGGTSSGIYSSLNCGYGSEDKKEHIIENRRRVSRKLHINPEALLTIDQMHSDKVILVPKLWDHDSAPQADGMVTNESGIGLGILTADCAPVLFADSRQGVIGACHAGWRGALGGIIEKTVEKMVSLGSLRQNINAVVGPCISQLSYQVSKEFKDQFVTTDQSYSLFFEEDGREHFRFSLCNFILNLSEKSKIKNCEIIRRDNYTETETFFSYRRSKFNQEKDYGRCISVIAMNF
jgi:YfiH family protein